MRTPDAPTQARLSEAYGKLPLSFEVNQGQVNAQVRFISRGSGYNLFLTGTEAGACQTQTGEYSRGDDIIGLNRAFLYAGTPTVIASLWSVAEQPTGDLMKAYFKHLKIYQLGKAEALQAAQKEMRATYPNPYYWASFVLTGDPGQ